jgi:arylsulfatase
MRKPNIILLMLDDMGFSDIGCYGGEIDTPNLDRLGHEGVRFTQFYNGARCCPTRASLLTGLYAHQAGVGAMVRREEARSYRGRLDPQTVTIAEALKQAGYRTLMSGKWHVGGMYDLLDPEQWRREMGDEQHPIPVQRGFDRFYGSLCGAGSYWRPLTLVEDDTLLEPPGEGYYFTDALGEAACRMIRESVAEDAGRPFFLYWAPTAPHWPLHAWPKDIEKYKGRYDGGWDELRKQRYARQLEMGILDGGWALSPRDEQSHPWVEARDKAWESLRMAVYAAQIDNLDQNVGRMLDTLEELGQAEDTLFLFLSDNGACAEFLAEESEEPRFPAQFAQPTADGEGTVQVGNRPGVAPGGDETFMSYDLPWANASNTPFRRFKSWTHEGGIATPLIAHWPAGMAGGRIFHGVGHIIDLMPTILDAAGAEYPRRYNGHDIPPAEGESLLGPITGEDAWQRSTPLFWEHIGCKAARRGDWKIVRDRHSDAWELYDLSRDRTELHDLAAERPEVVESLAGEWRAWAERVGVKLG